MSKNGRDGRDGRNGSPGLPGQRGLPGPLPKHIWNGTKIAFEGPEGFGPAIDLKGERGERGEKGIDGLDGSHGRDGKDGNDIKDISSSNDELVITTSRWEKKFKLPKGIKGKDGKGIEGPRGPRGFDGRSGEGVPDGGDEGDVLTKLSNKDFDTGWRKPKASTILSGGKVGRFVASVSGLDTDNTDPYNPIIRISVDGITILGDGTPGNPLIAVGGGGGSAAWGGILGTLSNQTDLQAALDSKVPNTRTVNGKPLSSDIVLDNNDIGLGNVLDVAQIPASWVDTDGTLSANSDSKIPTQKAVKTYADQLIAAADVMVFKGVIDASGNPNYPAADAGWTYRISVAGKIGGASGINVEVGDLLLCLVDGSPAGNQATVGANWSIAQTNIDGAVIGPASATDNAIVRYDGVSGKLIQNSNASIDDSGNITATNLSGTNTGDETATSIGTLINAATSKATPADADMFGLMDSAAGNVLKKLSWANVKATLKTYFDVLYSAASFTTISVAGQSDVVADAIADTLTLVAGSRITITTNAGTDTITIAQPAEIAPVGITIDGGGSAITTGLKGYIEVPYAGTIVGWTLLGDQTGSMVMDVWKDSYANYPPTVADTIAGTEKPTITAGVKGQDLSLTTWTTSVAAGDILGFNVDSCSSITRAHLIIRIQRT